MRRSEQNINANHSISIYSFIGIQLDDFQRETDLEKNFQRKEIPDFLIGGKSTGRIERERKGKEGRERDADDRFQFLFSVAFGGAYPTR